MKNFHSFKLFFIVLFLVENVKQSYQQPQSPIQNNYYQINLTQVTGPESIEFDCKGEGPYVGVSDGRILKWQGSNLGWKEFAITSPKRSRELCDGSTNPDLEPICGRPLGLKFNTATCHLYIADAYFGLLVVGPNGGVARPIATSAGGLKFKFTNGLDIDRKTGVIYFTDSSTFFQRRYVNYLELTHDSSGRLLKYDPFTNKVDVMYEHLVFPNGVALSQNNSFLLVAETTARRVLKFSLENGDKSYSPQVFAELPRVPDNIKSNEKGEFWIALHTGRLGSIPNNNPDPIGIKYDEEGNVLKQLDGNGGITLNSISEVNEFNGKLYIGSVTKSYISVLNA